VYIQGKFHLYTSHHLYRRRIHEKFNDGDTCTVYLKNRSQKQGHDEKEWYEQAFGSKQNLMTITSFFQPQHTEMLKKPGKCDLYAVIKFKIFEELAKEPEFKGKFPPVA